MDGAACGLDVTLCAGGATPVTVALGEERGGIDLSLEPMGAIAGRVVDTGGAAIRGLPLIVHDPRGGIAFALTDAEGGYVSEPLPRGAYTIATEGWPEPFEHVDQLYDGIPCYEDGCDITNGTPIAVAENALVQGIDFVLPRAFYINATVHAGGLKPQLHEVRSSDFLHSVGDFRLHYGLGKNTRVERIDVRWPDGKEESVSDLAADQLVVIGEGRGVVSAGPLVYR